VIEHALKLDPATVDAIAAAVVARLTDAQPDTAPALIDAAEVARRHGVTRSWAYDHAADLGAIRLGTGSRARLRFDPATVAAYLNRGRQDTTTAAPPAPPAPDRRPRRIAHPAAPLLPIRRHAA